jgi:integrating conjugative element protein (TIGR03757 family)
MKNLLPPKILFLLTAILFSAFLMAKETPVPNSIIIITSDKKPMRNIGYAKHLLQQVNATLEIYNLDEVHSFEDLFSKGLPANEEEARKVFEQRMNAYGAKKFEQEIVQAYQGLFNALVYEVDRYPVIIFNKTDAIYGMTDLKAALFKYQQWRLENDQ